VNAVACPEGRAGRREWLASVGAGTVRVRCGFTLATIGAALGVYPMTVQRWETGSRVPTGAQGEAYCRVIAGLARHLEATA
jgi:DNA-binding transcriptional regulator YiaG